MDCQSERYCSQKVESLTSNRLDNWQTHLSFVVSHRHHIDGAMGIEWSSLSRETWARRRYPRNDDIPVGCSHESKEISTAEIENTAAGSRFFRRYWELSSQWSALHVEPSSRSNYLVFERWTKKLVSRTSVIPFTAILWCSWNYCRSWVVWPTSKSRAVKRAIQALGIHP